MKQKQSSERGEQKERKESLTSPSRAWLRLNAFSVLACLLSCLLACLLVYLLACLPGYLLACLLACLLA